MLTISTFQNAIDLIGAVQDVTHIKRNGNPKKVALILKDIRLSFLLPLIFMHIKTYATSVFTTFYFLPPLFPKVAIAFNALFGRIMPNNLSPIKNSIPPHNLP